jgi:hypothetical protein
MSFPLVGCSRGSPKAHGGALPERVGDLVDEADEDIELFVCVSVDVSLHTVPVEVADPAKSPSTRTTTRVSDRPIRAATLFGGARASASAELFRAAALAEPDRRVLPTRRLGSRSVRAQGSWWMSSTQWTGLRSTAGRSRLTTTGS